MRDTDEESISDLVSRVVDDAREVARAEVEVAKARATTKLAGYRTGALMLVAAYLIGVAALIALLAGLILALSPLVGPWWALAIVVGVATIAAGILAKLGIDRIKRA